MKKILSFLLLTSLTSSMYAINEEIRNLRLSTTKQFNKTEKKMLVGINRSNELLLRDEPNENGKVIGSYTKIGMEFPIEECNHYGWCKLANRTAYVKQFMLAFK